MHALRPLRLVLLCIALAFAAPALAAPGAHIDAGAGEFTFTDAAGDATRPVTVYTYLPRRGTARDAPVVFVLHGFSRTARAFRDDWAYHADRYGFLVVAPLFDRERWGSDYAVPSSREANATTTSFALIEHLFDAINAATGGTRARYRIYGFSEGGQFVHRLVLTQPDARYERAVIGTPGWYTMPDVSAGWPYGLKNTHTDSAALKRILERDVVLLLGEQDDDPNHYQLSKTPQAVLQGPHRVARGRNFFRQAEARAAELDARFAWRLQTVPGAAHDARKMSPAASALLAD